MMMPQKDAFAQVLCDLAVSIEISKQLESELDLLRRIAVSGSGQEYITTPHDLHLISAFRKPTFI